MYSAYVTRVKNIRPAANSDNLNLCEAFGNTVVIDKTIAENELCLYFPSDGQISAEFGMKNNLFRTKDGKGGFVDPNKRNIKAIKLRGNKSDGLILPLSCVEYTGVNISDLKEGDKVTVLNGHEICRKYIPYSDKMISRKISYNTGQKKKRENISPLFLKHTDTEQLAYNLGEFKAGDQIEITLKMHGTSQRTGYLPVLKEYKKSFWDRITKREGKPIYKWDYVAGTRRTVLVDYDHGFYGSNAFRERHVKALKGKLHKGETVYGEIVGFTDTGAPIMPSQENSKTKDADFIKQYGDTTVFSYDCSPNAKRVVYGKDDISSFSIEMVIPQSEFYVYRMTLTNEDGYVVEYSPDLIRSRCEEMGVKTVPVLYKGFIPFDCENPGEWVKNLAEQYYDGPDPIGKTHIREGVVVRIVNRPKFCALKHKNFNFKVLENIIKENSVVPDMEEAEEIL